MKKDELSNLVYHKKNIYESSSEEELKKIFNFAEGYKSFLNNCKTERECCSQVIEEAKAKGFSEFHFGDKLKRWRKDILNSIIPLLQNAVYLSRSGGDYRF